MIDNYRYSIFTLSIGERKQIDFEFIRNLIKIYNENDYGHQFLLKPNGIYDIFKMILTSRRDIIDFEKYCQEFIEFMKDIKNIYNDEFDINFKVGPNQSDYTDIGDNTVITYLLKHYGYDEQSKHIVNFIVTEFKDKLDVNNPCLMTYVMKNHRYELFQCLLTNYNDNYSLNKICEIMMKMMNDITEDDQSGNFWNRHCWNKWNKQNNKQFLDCVKSFCLQKKCENDKDKEYLKKCIDEIWEKYSQIIDKEKPPLSVSNDDMEGLV